MVWKEGYLSYYLKVFQNDACFKNKKPLRKYNEKENNFKATILRETTAAPWLLWYWYSIAYEIMYGFLLPTLSTKQQTGTPCNSVVHCKL